MHPTLQHPSEAKLRDFSAGLLAEPALAEVSLHLEECPACCNRMSELASSGRALAWMRRLAIQPADANHALDALADTFAEQEDALHFLQPSTRPDSLGRIGHYEALQVLGKGAFGIVLRAFDDVLQRVVAVKVLAPHLATTSPARKRFLREARSVAAIRHDNVVQVYEVGEQPVPYLVMEFIPGETLAQRLHRTGPLDVLEVLRIGRQIAEGLAAAHANHLIHRDIKPGNLLIDEWLQSVKITDFGLTRAVDDASMTQSGYIAGTPMYMAPEQALGHKLDVRADLFSLGSVLYQMVSGRPPFRAPSTLAVLKRVAEEPPRPIQEIISETPTWLSDIIAKLHAKNPADRYQSSREVADVLADCEAQLKANGKVKYSSRVPTGKPTRSGPWRLVVAAALLLPVIALAWTETAAVTDLFRRMQPTPGPIQPGPEPNTPPKKETPPIAAWHGWPADAPPPARAPFDTKTARAHQEAWATYLGVKLEHTNSIGMKFILIPPGEFMMGSTHAEIEAESLKTPNNASQIESEGPQHKVTLTQPFYLGVHDVTQKNYETVMGENPSHFSALGEGKDKVAGMDTSNHPVEYLYPKDTIDFCIKLSENEKLKPLYARADDVVARNLQGNGYRLPTEAEWEFACRAGTTIRYWIGDEDEDLLRTDWVASNSGNRTHPVGELLANPFGLFDVHGNVGKLMQDWWGPTYYDQCKEQPAVDPRGPPTGINQVVRGTNFSWSPCGGRSAARRSQAGGGGNRTLTRGFRTVLTVAAVKQMLKN